MTRLTTPSNPTPPVSTTLVAEDTLMFREAGSAADIVAAQLAANADLIKDLAARLRAMAPKAVVTCARGSSDHAASFGKYLIETRLGLVTSSAGMSVASVYGVAPRMDGMLFLAISQSGKSPDLVASADAARKAGAHVVAFVNVVDSPLADVAHDVVPLGAGPELSVAATKSYIASLSALLHLVSLWAEDDVMHEALLGSPALLKTAFEADWSPAVARLKDTRNMFVLGRGLGFGIALEAALKFKETCGLHAEAFSAAEVKHGPMALVEAGFPILAFVQNDATHEGTDAIVAEMIRRGADVLLAGSTLPEATVLPGPVAHPAIAPMISIQSFYRMAATLSVARGYHPDQPPHLAKVTETR